MHRTTTLKGQTMNLLKHFDLNRRTTQAKRGNDRRVGDIRGAVQQRWRLNTTNSSDTRLEHLMERCWAALTRHDEGDQSIAEQLLMYVGVLLGVYCSGMIRGQEVQPTLLLAALIALIIVPISFEKLSVNPRAPLLVRFGLFVQNGVFWDVLLEALQG